MSGASGEATGRRSNHGGRAGGQRTGRRDPSSPGSGLVAGCLFLALAAGLAGCATAPAERPPAPVDTAVAVPAADRPFLVPPATGWDGPLPPQAAEALAGGHDALLEGRLAEARTAAREAAAATPGEQLAPATLLAAQADFVAGDWRAAADAAARLAAERPAYLAAQLLRGRALERSDRPVEAFEGYFAVAELSEAAAGRLDALRPRVVEILSHRVDEAIRGGDPVAAAEILGRLRLWAPAEAATVRAAWRVAEARGDRQGELRALRELFSRHGPVEERELVERRATLELAVGAPGTGVELFEELVREHPGDPLLAERLASAKFLWRVTQLPPQVADAAAMPELDRGGFSVLLYWLVPQVRYGGGGTARIASDILEDPRREEIARVINLGLLDLDSTVHRFYPDNPIRRSRALGALVRLVASTGAGCGDAGAGAEGGPAGDETCAAALACGLVATAEECTATPGLTGSEALELLRRTQDVLGGS